MSHLLSSVDLVLYCDSVFCDTNGPTHAPTVLSLAPSAASVFASCFGWAIADCALNRLASQSGAFTVPVHYCSSCVVVCFIHHALLRALISSILASNATDPANHHQWINHESSMTISTSSIDH
jgi:hypothetical protein